MPVLSPRDLFLHDLSDIYAAEQQIVEMLPLLADEAADDRVRSALLEHEGETRQQIRNLEECFQLLRAQPERVTCHAVEGLMLEHESVVRQNPPQDVLTLFDLGAEIKTEYYEMASYRGLVDRASRMGEQDVARLLQENLRQEEEMARRVEELTRTLGEEQAGGMR